MPGFQDKSNTGNKESDDPLKAGPTPEGDYNIDLRPPITVAKIGRNGDMKGKDGIEQIPTAHPIYGDYSQGWGTYRARLEPLDRKNMKGRGSVYIHNSHKGKTHGCQESEGLTKAILDAKKRGQKDFGVRIKYTDPSTFGDTIRN